MNRIVSKHHFSENVVQLEVLAPYISRNRKPGHFVIVRIDENGERIPLTISGSSSARETITLVIQKVGVTSSKLASLEVGDSILDVVGPLGKATHIENVGTVLMAGGGVGIAPLLPIVEGFKKAGNRVLTVLAARNKNLILLENEIRKHSDEVLIVTDDGSYGNKGLVTDGMEKFIQKEKIHSCVAIGPAIMMKFACKTTQKYNIPTLVSLNTIMVDGTGMCGACRVSVAGKTKFVCVDGPEFDGHSVDFDEMLQRLSAYKAEESAAYEKYLQNLEK